MGFGLVGWGWGWGWGRGWGRGRVRVRVGANLREVRLRINGHQALAVEDVFGAWLGIGMGWVSFRVRGSGAWACSACSAESQG